MAVVLGDALVQARDFAEQVSDYRVGPAGQILQLVQCLAPHCGGLERPFPPCLIGMAACAGAHRSDQLQQLGAGDAGVHQHGTACSIDALHRKNTFLARSIPTVTIPMDFPFRTS
jgi:hypothetical protein